MILGRLSLGEKALQTHNDSYVLDSISAVSTRRPFLSIGLIISGLLGTFTLSFLDLLYLHEIGGLALAAILVLVGGLSVGQLRLVSRDLRGSPIADAIYGSYRHLNRLRPEIADAVERAKTGGVS